MWRMFSEPPYRGPVDKRASALAAIVAIGGLVVIGGWVADIPWLTSVHPGWVTMKPATALCFVLLGTGLLSQPFTGTFHTVVCAILVLLLVSGFTLESFGVALGLRETFALWDSDRLSELPGEPSIATLACFGVGSIGLLFRSAGRLGRWFGPFIVLCATHALFGYVADRPALYFRISGTSSAMAIHTAALFLLWGVAFTFLGRGPWERGKANEDAEDLGAGDSRDAGAAGMAGRGCAQSTERRSHDDGTPEE